MSGTPPLHFADSVHAPCADTQRVSRFAPSAPAVADATKTVSVSILNDTTIQWFDFPSFGQPGGVTIGGDVIAALTDKPGVKDFIQYMTTVDSGTTWAKTGIIIISPLKGVAADVYPNESAKKEAAQVANAPAVRFDGQDLLPAGGPDFGAMLQGVIKGDPIDGLVSAFQTAQAAAWAAE